MSGLNFIAEVWEAITHNMNTSDRSDAADSLINLLIDNNYEAEDIKEAFRGDHDVLGALKDYGSIDIDEEYLDYDEDEFDDE